MLSSKTIWIFFSICLLILLFNSNIYAQSADKDFSLKIKNGIVSAQLDSVEVSKIDNYYRVKIKGLNNFAAPGEPLLPIKTVKYLIPYGKKIANVSVGWTSKKYLYGTYLVEPAQAPARTDYSGKVERTLPKADVYSKNSPYPEKMYKIVSTQDMRGYQVLIINLYPVEYIPATGKLAYYDNLNLNITCTNQPAALSKSNSLYRGIAADQQAVSLFVDNPENINTYPLNKAAKLATVNYLIITNHAFATYSGANDLNDLLDHKRSKGLSAEMLDTATIYANYSGADNIEKIRTCIRTYYTSNQTQYVLLVGDADGGGIATGETEAAPIIPVRGLYGKVNDTGSPDDPDNNIPCDMYYGCLGTFDFDGDGIYGELNDGEYGGEVDLAAEVYIGRAPVDDETELDDFVRKTIAYENSNADYLTRACMVSEDLSSTATPFYAKPYMEEIRNGSSSNGYTTRGMAESGYFSFTTLYEQDAAWVDNDLLTIINNGVHIINHLGHATNTIFANTISNANIDALTNTDYLFGYTQGCYSGAFDNRQSDGVYGTSDSALEHFIKDDHGAFAFIGNSRYGWYDPSGTDGGSQRLQRLFWDAQVREGITNIGRALQAAKDKTIGVVGAYNDYRWAYFTTNLLGDPETSIKAALLSPTNFSANSIAFADNGWVTLSWKNSARADLTHIMIRYRTDGTYPTSETDGTLLLYKAVTSGTTETYNHTTVTAGTTYNYIGFGYNGTVYDGATATNNLSTVTVAQGSGTSDSSGSSNCFVATACYGDQHAPEVMKLRKFRDNYLMHDYRGREFVSFYYIVGPKLAAMIVHNDFAKKTVRYWLGPLVKVSEILNKGDL